MKHGKKRRSAVLSAVGAAAFGMVGCAVTAAPAPEGAPKTTATAGPASASPPGSASTTPTAAPTQTTPPITEVPGAVLWAKESVHPMRWAVPTDAGRLDETVTLAESVDAGATWTTLAEVEAIDKYFRWKIPANASHGRFAVIFHRTEDGATKEVRRVETPDVPFGPSQRRDYVWTKVADSAPFGPRDGAGGVVFGGKMWLIGGWNPLVFPLHTANDVWSSVDGVTWVQEKPNTFLNAATFPRTDWEGRHFAGYHAFAGKMWIVGGDANQGHYQTDVWSSTNGATWTRTDLHTVQPRIDPATGLAYPPEEWAPVEIATYGLRTAHVTGVIGNRLFLMGGQRVSQFVDPVWPGAPARAFNDVWSSGDGAAFTQLTTVGKVWEPRGFVSEVVELGGKMWMIGGGLYDDPTEGRPDRQYFNDVWSSSDGASWTTSAAGEAPFSPRIWHDVKAYDGRLWVINGYDGGIPSEGRAGGNLGDAWSSADGVNWYDASPPSTYVPRHAGTAWVHNGALFVGSGNEIDDEWRADVWKMVPKTP